MCIVITFVLKQSSCEAVVVMIRVMIEMMIMIVKLVYHRVTTFDFHLTVQFCGRYTLGQRSP